jgi:hypothetical protein
MNNFCVLCLSFSVDDKLRTSGATVDSKLGEQDLPNSGNSSSNGLVTALRVLDGEGRTQGPQIQSSQANVAVKEEYDSSATVSCKFDRFHTVVSINQYINIVDRQNTTNPI